MGVRETRVPEIFGLAGELVIAAFREPMFFHMFSILAFVSVAITYFGVNFILGGMHSYA